MKILLPSHGLFGQSRVNMKIPTIGVIHELQSYNQDELLKKYKFLELITDINLSKVTYHDLIYCYLIGAFSLIYNRAEYTIECDCGESFDTTVCLTDQEVIELKIKRNQYPFTKRLNLKKFTFHLLSAQQVLDCYLESKYDEEESKTFELYKTALILGLPMKAESIKNLNHSLYLSAHLYQEIHYHGIDPVVKCTCPKCNKEKHFRFNLSTSVLDFDIEHLMSKFVSISDTVSFSDFLKMSIVDLNATIAALNKQVR